MSDNILEVNGLSMHFPLSGGAFRKSTSVVRAVEDVSFSVKRGETFGVVGESGSGKTTLGRCIMRILTPTAGTIQYTGKAQEPVELVTSDDSLLRTIWRDIRMVFQDPQSSLNPRLPVIEIVGQCLRKSEKLSGSALADRVSTLLTNVGLRPEILHRYPGAFSGGQRQRLGIARALATNPQLVVADEAVSALDVSIQAQTLNLMQDLQEQFELTYIFIAHDLAVVEHICDRVAVMYLGQIVELADKDELFNNPKHPYTRALLNAVPVPDPRKRPEKRARRGAGEIPSGGVRPDACQFAPRCPHAQDICRNSSPPEKQIDGVAVLCHFAGEI
ncbi:ABC transporter ATP-binding protein [Devosia algicola]|uniref:ABC transporter ATP-binding protein n=1 Tax=Devosia algicola TaxID=3026418 RepID=A0ABY7YRN3_9HYPH|nr:ABC transporter ATP-binding protein [Devosia algicola]WDR03926.1 ABC transporter ATP-binding protein [Devosia algicola]